MKKMQMNVKWTAWDSGVGLLFSACSQNSGNEGNGLNRINGGPVGHDMAAGSSNNKMMDLMHENMTKMQGMKMTVDVDHDFAQLMAIHNECVLTMAQEEADNG